jgi:hypothetical protein
MFFKKKPFKLGDSVRFKDGQKDEDSDVDMSGWQGRVIEIDTRQKLVLVALDSLTLKSLPREYLEESEEEGLNWAEYYIGFDDVELIQPRDTQKVVEETVTALSNSVGWAFLGEEGRDINAVLAGADNEHAQRCLRCGRTGDELVLLSGRFYDLSLSGQMHTGTAQIAAQAG